MKEGTFSYLPVDCFCLLCLVDPLDVWGEGREMGLQII